MQVMAQDRSADALTAFAGGDFATARACLSDLAPTTPEVIGNVDHRITYNGAVLSYYDNSIRPGIPDPLSILNVTVGWLPEECKLSLSSPATLDENLAALCTSSGSALPTIRAKAGFVPIYNAGVLAYNSGRISAASTLGAYLYAHVEAMEDWLALKACLLFIDINLRTGDCAMAAKVIAYLEQMIPVLVEAMAAHTTAPAPPAASSLQSNNVAPQYREITHSSPHFPTLSPPWFGQDMSLFALPKSLNELTFCLHIYSARLNAATDDQKMLRKEAKHAVVLSEDEGRCPTAAALLVKAKLETNAAKVLRVMESIRNQSPPKILVCAWPLLLNNIGVIHHRMGCHHLAALYLEQARKSFHDLLVMRSQSAFDPADTPNPASVPNILALAAKTHVSYNLGLQYLVLGKFRPALTCFASCAQNDEILASKSAMLWIRIAECCVGEADAEARKNTQIKVCGLGQGRRYVISCPAKTDESLILMQYAAISARAALHILDSSSKETVSSAVSDDPTSGPPSSSGIFQSTVDQTREAALSLLAYATLSFDPSSAIQACDLLGSTPRPSISPYRVLGSLYHAEALCEIGRPGEAADRLALLLTTVIPDNLEVREAALMNMALAHVLREDYPSAGRAAETAWKMTETLPLDHNLRKHATLIAAYASLREKNTENAKQLLRTYR